jgi:hypothetical protein
MGQKIYSKTPMGKHRVAFRQDGWFNMAESFYLNNIVEWIVPARQQTEVIINLLRLLFVDRLPTDNHYVVAVAGINLVNTLSVSFKYFLKGTVDLVKAQLTITVY